MEEAQAVQSIDAVRAYKDLKVPKAHVCHVIYFSHPFISLTFVVASCQPGRRTRFLLRFGKQLDRERAKRRETGVRVDVASELLSSYEEPAPDDAASDLSELSDLFDVHTGVDVQWMAEDVPSDAESELSSDGEFL